MVGGAMREQSSKGTYWRILAAAEKALALSEEIAAMNIQGLDASEEKRAALTDIILICRQRMEIDGGMPQVIA